MSDEITQTDQTPPAGDTSVADGASAYLVTIAGIRVGEMFKLPTGETVLGRSDEADLRLVDEGVSRLHAAVTVEGTHVVLKDLGSVNGTYCNGSRISTPRVLTDGDKISMGGTTILKFTYQDDLEERFSKNLYESAVKDGLTGLHNRRYFDERLRAEVTFSARHLSELALLLIDLDHFKRINDRWGHQVGDATLRELARRLAATVRTEDTTARFGGEEFAILCRNTGETKAVVLADRLRAIVAKPLQIPKVPELQITASVGLAVMPRAEVHSESDLVRAADSALYLAKGHGRNLTVAHGDQWFILNTGTR
jgi:diguanylate cyclase (GGDEF)-like protein